MKISAKTEYACKALIELALHWPSEIPVQIGTIAKRQKIPLKFLTQILVNLKQAGYVNSIRGKNGGYLLAHKPKNISFAQVLEDFGEIEEYDATKSGTNRNVLKNIWDELNGAIHQQLQTITLEYIIQRIKEKDNVMMFNI